MRKLKVKSLRGGGPADHLANERTFLPGTDQYSPYGVWFRNCEVCAFYPGNIYCAWRQSSGTWQGYSAIIGVIMVGIGAVMGNIGLPAL